jgi:deazaflavin-dependent oxidoreductase (nitroreductase family)
LWRLAFRLPVVLYHLGLGRLLGQRFLLLVHRGRNSGQVRQTALEVVRSDPATHTYVVVSAWGERADWYRNLRARPALAVQVGREQFVPVHRFLTPDEVYAELLDYRRRHPWLLKGMAAWLGFPLGGSDAALHALAGTLRMVALTSADRGDRLHRKASR